MLFFISVIVVILLLLLLLLVVNFIFFAVVCQKLFDFLLVFDPLGFFVEFEVTLVGLQEDFGLVLDGGGNGIRLIGHVDVLLGRSCSSTTSTFSVLLLGRESQASDD